MKPKIVAMWPTTSLNESNPSRTCWGYSFQLTPEHLTLEHMSTLKSSYDELGDETLRRLNQLSKGERGKQEESKETKEPHGLPPKPEAPSPGPPQDRDLYAILSENWQESDVLSNFWTEIQTVPSWVDWKQIQAGQEVFYR